MQEPGVPPTSGRVIAAQRHHCHSVLHVHSSGRIALNWQLPSTASVEMQDTNNAKREQSAG